jgi:dethiobiotin synthetase
MSAYFVTATGTDIGKTFVTAGLLRALRGRDNKVAALKPIVSGFDMANARVSDPGVLLEAMGEAPTPDAVARISPWRFAAPLSPDMAAARERREIDFNAVVAFCREAIAERDGPLFIEGVGGVMVPLDARHTVLDWMAALDIPAILVAGSYLGTISHTLTAIGALTHAGVKVAALVVSDSGDGAVPLVDTMETLTRFIPQTIPTTVFLRTPDDVELRFARLTDLLIQGVT